jgi:hypothetical protein
MQCFVRFSEKTAIIFRNTFNRLTIVMHAWCFYGVETECFNVTKMDFRLERVIYKKRYMI